MTRYGPLYAVRLCRSVGHRQPLIERLRDPDLQTTQDERRYLADVLAGTEPPWPTPEQVIVNREKLRRTAHYLEFLCRDGGRGKIEKWLKLTLKRDPPPDSKEWEGKPDKLKYFSPNPGTGD